MQYFFLQVQILCLGCQSTILCATRKKYPFKNDSRGSLTLNMLVCQRLREQVDRVFSIQCGVLWSAITMEIRTVPL